MDVNALGFGFVTFSPFHHDGQIKGNSPQRVIDDLVGLPGLHPNEITSPYVALYIRLEIAPGYPPVGWKRKGQKVGEPEENVIGGYIVLGFGQVHFAGSIKEKPNAFE